MYRFKNNVGKSNFSEKFRKLINRYKRIGYSLDIMRQTACLVVNPIIVDGYASLFDCTTAVGPQTQWWPLRKTLTSGLGLDDMSLAWPAVVQVLVFRTLAYRRISHEYSSLFIIVINLILCLRFDAMTELGAFMRTEFLYVSVLRVASGPRVKLASCKSALTPRPPPLPCPR